MYLTSQHHQRSSFHHTGGTTNGVVVAVLFLLLTTASFVTAAATPPTGNVTMVNATTTTTTGKPGQSCPAEDCEGLTKPNVTRVTCPRGFMYTEMVMCVVQKKTKNCGWTATQKCIPLPPPPFCQTKHCAGLNQPTLSCPKDMILESTNYLCTKQSNGFCGWKADAQCQSKTTTTTTTTIADAGGQQGQGKQPPQQTPPSSSSPAAAAAGTGGIRGTPPPPPPPPKVVVTPPPPPPPPATTAVVVCEPQDCMGMAKPKLSTLTCPDSMEVIETAACVLQKRVNKCGWVMRGKCQKKK